MLFVVYVLQFLARQKNIGVGQVVVVVVLLFYREIHVYLKGRAII